MLKTNSKKARENIRAYILDHFTPDGFTDTPPTEPREVLRFIYNCFISEKFSIENEKRYYKYNEYNAFVDWCAGLPSALDTCYYYNRSAVDDLGAILEETETEKARYTEADAEKLLTYLIYTVIKKELEKQ